MTAWRALARRLSVVVLLLATTAAPRAQEDAVPIPPYTGYVTDVAEVIGDERQAQLESFLDQLQQKTGVQFAVLTLASTAPEEPSTFKTRVFNAWGIGDAERDDGLLLLIAMEQRQARFETGYGLEGTLPDGWQSRMIRDLLVPRFRAGEPEEGITAAVLASAQRIAKEKGVTLEWDGEELRYDEQGGDASWARYLPFVVLLLLFYFIIPAIRSGRRGRRGWRGADFSDWGGGWGGGFGGSSGGFGGGGGSSFGGFGGGSSGGGGGGGSW